MPHVNTREQADSIARAARYYPEGRRGAGGGRSQDYGVGVSRDEALRWVNSQIMVIPMCEEVEAVENLDEILTVAGEESRLLGPNEYCYVPRGARHRLENPGDKKVRLIEVQYGNYLGEDDIIRFDDIYGRK